MLPYSKDEIFSALLNSVTPGDGRKNDLMLAGAVCLAQSQPSVGREALYHGGFDLTQDMHHWAPTTGIKALRAEALAMAAKGNAYREQTTRFEAFSSLVKQDLNLMLVRFKVATKGPESR